MDNHDDRMRAWVGVAPLRSSAMTGWTTFASSDELLLSARPYDFSSYVVCLRQDGVPGLDLVRLIRRRCNAVVVALSEPPHTDCAAAFDQGADLVLASDIGIPTVESGLRAVFRRGASATFVDGPWTLTAASNELLAPDGTTIALTPTELAIVEAFTVGEDKRVSKEALAVKLWGHAQPVRENAMHAALYRLRKRVEQAGQPMWPIHAVSGYGYEFRAPLKCA